MCKLGYTKQSQHLRCKLVIDSTLRLLETWFNEASIGPERPKFLSKLALLELCGWLEGELDRIVVEVDKRCLSNSCWIGRDPTWVEKKVVNKTFGFDYDTHFRRMLASVLGEHLTCKLEATLDDRYPGDLDKLKSYTGDLWKKRCAFAHGDIVCNVATQQRFDAPSWCQNQHRVLSKILLRVEEEAMTIASVL